MIDPRRRNRQLAVALVALLLVNFPVLAVVDQLRLANGVPATPLYLFFVWLAIILAMALLSARGSD